MNIETLEQIPVGDKNFELEDVSPDGQHILASQDTNLFVLNSNGEIKTKLSETLLNQIEMDAYWHSTDQIIFIGKEGDGPYVYLTNPGGNDLLKLSETGKKPFMLYPSYDSAYVYWEEGFETSTGSYQLGTWRSNIDGSGQTQSDLPQGLSPSGNYIAYSVDPNMNTIGGEILYIANSDGTDEIEIMELKEPMYLVGLFWSSDEEKFLVQVLACEPKCDKYSHYLISVDEMIIVELPSDVGRIFHTGVWSADNQLFLYKKLFITETDASMGLGILNLDTMDINTIELSRPENFWINNLMWVPIGTNK